MINTFQRYGYHTITDLKEKMLWSKKKNGLAIRILLNR